MAKVNLLTIHWGNSYGAIFQAFATSRILEECGHDVTVLNLRPEDTKKRYKNIRNYLTFKLVCDFQFFLFKKRNFPKIAPVMFNLDSTKIPSVDCTVVGSDQVWNSDITKNIAEAFFLSYVISGRKVSLASSFGKSQIEVKKKWDAINNFDAVSVREKSAVHFLKKELGINAPQLIDPTLAYGQFDSLVRNVKQKKHIGTFVLHPTKEHKEILNTISQHLNMPINKKSTFQYHFKSSPKDWLRAIKSSSVFVTDSFHGLAFCLLFKKRFFVVCANKNQFTRLSSLLELVGLSGRYIQSVEDLKSRMEIIDEIIDYKPVDTVLKQESLRYYSFVQNNIF